MTEELFPNCLKKLDEVFCGCATQETTWGAILAELERCEAGRYESNDSVVQHLVAWGGLSEHGVSIRGSWLTKNGKEALAFLRKHGIDWSDKGEFVDDENVMHGSPQP